ncbi:MAG: M56 family metallopeptidase [Bacteroidaceae bacterium]|jgi:beta-lactamase regulating signal transducer with metallopeptidase domain
METLSLLLVPIGKFIACTLIFYAFYWLFLRKRASYSAIRLYLLTLPAACLLMALSPLQITLPGKTVYLPAPAETALQESSATARLSTPEAAAFTPAAPQATPGNSMSLIASGRHFSPAKAVLALYLLPLFALILYRLASLAYAARLKRTPQERETYAPGIEIVRSNRVRTPFSFHKTIYLPLHILPAQREIILHHEAAHIALRHYRDVWLMEILACLFWFNPMIWWIRAELRRIHEFQADQTVLQNGTELHAYQATLLQEAVRNGCVLANGLSQSFTRRRFLAMKDCLLRRRMPRLLRLTAGATGLVLCFVCSVGITRAETRYVTSAPKPVAAAEKAPASVPQTTAPAAEPTAPASSLQPAPTEEDAAQTSDTPAPSIELTIQTAETPAALQAEIPAPAAKKPKTFTKAPRKMYDEKDYDYQNERTYSAWTDAEVAPRVYMMSTERDGSPNGKPRKNWQYGLLRTPEATYVFEICMQHWDWHWWVIPKESQLIDCDTQASYFIRGVEHFPFHRYFWIRDQKNQPVVMVEIFAPLPDSTQTIIFSTKGSSQQRDRTEFTNTPPMKVSDLEANWRDLFAAKAKENR